MKKLNKAISFTDIHWGAKANSIVHNEDCMDFIDWVITLVEADPEIDHIMFLGDWHENRSALNLSTLNYSFKGLSKLNKLGLPIYLIVGNHDLYHRHTREVHSLPHFDELENVILIEEVTLIEETYYPSLMSPYLFDDEYGDLKKHLDVPIWWGHFEFKGFVLTGYNITMPTGPDIEEYKTKRIFSGHFHKRQINNHVAYIGNTFPTTFGDEGDTNRGVAIYQYDTDDLSFIDWDGCPLYKKIKLSELIEDEMDFPEKTHIKCVVDIVMDYDKQNKLKHDMTEKYSFRDFKYEETSELADEFSKDEDIVELEEEHASVNELVVALLDTISTDKINKEKLKEWYMVLDQEYDPSLLDTKHVKN